MEQVKPGVMSREMLLDKLRGAETFEKVTVQHKTEHTEEIDANPALLQAKIECEQRNIERYERRIEECQGRIRFYEATLLEIRPKEEVAYE